VADNSSQEEEEERKIMEINQERTYTEEKERQRERT
jgi:hypothetical protein